MLKHDRRNIVRNDGLRVHVVRATMSLRRRWNRVCGSKVKGHPVNNLGQIGSGHGSVCRLESVLLSIRYK